MTMQLSTNPRSAVPILMYHMVGRPVQCKRDRFLNISERDFKRQMEALALLGYRARTMGEVLEAWRSGASLPGRTVVVTFDDAYRAVGEIAAPLMERLGFTGTLFVVSSWASTEAIVGVENGRLDAPVLDWHELRGLQSRGWEAGGHTATHPHLDSVSDAVAIEEIALGKEIIEAQLNTKLRSFCYPFGYLSQMTASHVQQAGFLGACTVRSGIVTTKTDPYLMPRVKVSYSDGVLGLLYRLLVRPSLPNLRRQRRSESYARRA